MFENKNNINNSVWYTTDLQVATGCVQIDKMSDFQKKKEQFYVCARGSKGV